MIVTIKNLQQQEFKLDVSDNDTIGSIKAQICSKKDCSIQELKLIFSGSVLSNDDKTVKDLNLKDTDFFVMLIKKVEKTETNSTEVKEEPVKETQTSNIPPVQPFNMFEQPSQNSGVPPVEPFNMFAPPPNPSGQVPGNMGGMDGMGDAQEFLNMLMNDPEVQQFAQQNPEQFQQILNNPQVLQQILSGVMPGMPPMGGPEQITIELTPEEEEDINQLVAMGFNKIDSVQYYRAAGNNLELAAGMLMEEKEADYEFEEQNQDTSN